MRVVSWNIRAGGGTRAEAIVRQLARWRPALAVLCEFRGTPPSQYIASELAEMGLIHQRSTASPELPTRNALLVASTWPLRCRAMKGAPTEPARWLSVRAAAPEPFLVGALHVPNQATGRKYEFHDAVVSVASGWAGQRALIIGDTNTGWPSLDEEVPCFGPREERFLRALESTGWIDGFRHLHPRARAYTWYSPNGGNGFRLDQGFLSPALRPKLRSAKYKWGRGRVGQLSDHSALLLDLAER